MPEPCVHFEEDDPREQLWRTGSQHIFLHDFGDGCGAVPAYRHRNFYPFPHPGGWVACSAKVSSLARVDRDASVFGTAQVGKNVHLMAGARVQDAADIRGPLIVGKNVVFRGYARVRNQPQVRHPVYIGYPPLSLPDRTYDLQKGGFVPCDHSRVPPIDISVNPDIWRWYKRAEGRYEVHTLVITDHQIIRDVVYRASRTISGFRDEMQLPNGPGGQDLYSWRPEWHQVEVRFSKNEPGQRPEFEDVAAWLPGEGVKVSRLGGLVPPLLLEQDRRVCRVVRIPARPWQRGARFAESPPECR